MDFLRVASDRHRIAKLSRRGNRQRKLDYPRASLLARLVRGQDAGASNTDIQSIPQKHRKYGMKLSCELKLAGAWKKFKEVW